MGKHSKNGISYWEARGRRKDLRSRQKPPKRKGPFKKRWFVMFFVIGLLLGLALGVFYKDIGKLGAKVYLSFKQRQWQPKGKEKKEVEKALATLSTDQSKSINTLVIGSDVGSNKKEGGWCRSDVMMLVCLLERDKRAVVISIPRDTRVQIAGRGFEKINAAHSFGGPSGAIDAVKQLLGMDVHHYLSMNFQGFKQIIDAIGGVPIHLNQPINDPHAGYLPAGDLKLDGEQALVIVRSRKSPGGDIDRIKSQQVFLKALINKAAGMRNVWKGKQIVDIIAGSCQMDYSAGQLTTLAEELKGFPIANAQFVTIPGQAKNIGGGSYFIADQQKVAELAGQVKTDTMVSPELMAGLQAYAESTKTKVEELYDPGADVLTVLGSGKSAAAVVPVVSQELRLLGHQKVFEGISKQALPKTTMYHRREAAKYCEDLKATVPEFADADVQLNDQVTAQYNSPVVIVLGSGFATPNLYSLYGRVIKPALNLDNLGKRVKSFS